MPRGDIAERGYGSSEDQNQAIHFAFLPNTGEADLKTSYNSENNKDLISKWNSNKPMIRPECQ